MQNISTRLPVRTGDQVGIAGFILQGNAPKNVIFRAIGPSMAINGTPVAGRLQNPTLELRNSAGELIAENNDWRSSQEAEIIATGLAPTDDRESAIVRRLLPGEYTAIIRGVGESSGIGLVEIFDLETASDSRLGNLSTRGNTDTGDNVLIGGIILRGGDPQKIVVRAMGPSLTSKGVSGALVNPTIALHDESGNLLMENNDWRESQQAEIEATGIAPDDDRESAIVRTLSPGNFTAIVRGEDGSTGVALVEAYNLGQP